jgi:hypothetical protein
MRGILCGGEALKASFSRPSDKVTKKVNTLGSLEAGA